MMYKVPKTAILHNIRSFASEISYDCPLRSQCFSFRFNSPLASLCKTGNPDVQPALHLLGLSMYRGPLHRAFIWLVALYRVATGFGSEPRMPPTSPTHTAPFSSTYSLHCQHIVGGSLALPTAVVGSRDSRSALANACPQSNHDRPRGRPAPECRTDSEHTKCWGVSIIWLHSRVFW